jgi:hypothetical protein
MSTRLEIQKVNRYEADWDPSTIFTGFTIRAVLTSTEDMVTRIMDTARLQKRLGREVGEQGVDWKIRDNPTTDETELYLQNSGKLIMWKLQDHEGFSKLFDRVEQHVDNIDEIRDNE